MLGLINKLQRKPEHVRKQIALWFAATVTVLIVIVWAVRFSFDVPSTSVTASAGEVGPFRALSEGIGTVLDDTVEKLGNIGDVFGAPPEEETPEMPSP